MKKIIYINDIPTKYEIYDDGRIYSHITEKFLKPFINPCGYHLIDISIDSVSYTRQVHRLVAQTFIPNPEKLPTVNHKNGNKLDNSVGNLEWMSMKDNVRHAWDTGLAKPKYGTDNSVNIYSEQQIRSVCEMLEVGKYTSIDIFNKTGVKHFTVLDIKNKRSWLVISSEYNIPDKRNGYTEFRNDIIKLMINKKSNIEIFKMLNELVPLKHIQYIRRYYNI